MYSGDITPPHCSHHQDLKHFLVADPYQPSQLSQPSLSNALGLGVDAK